MAAAWFIVHVRAAARGFAAVGGVEYFWVCWWLFLDGGRGGYRWWL